MTILVTNAENLRRVGQEPPTVGGDETEAIALGMELSCSVVLVGRA